jgi:hypothetical protein
MCTERHFLDVVRVHKDMLVARLKIELGEEGGVVQFIEKLFNHRYWEPVLHGVAVLLEDPPLPVQP